MEKPPVSFWQMEYHLPTDELLGEEWRPRPSVREVEGVDGQSAGNAFYCQPEYKGSS